MEYRPLGRTGVQVSEALPRHDDVRRLGQHRPRRLDPHHPPRARRRDQLRRHRRRLLRRRVRGDRRQGAEGPSRRRRPGHQVLHARWTTTPTTAADRAAGSSPRSRTRCDGCGTDWIDLYQVHRPGPDTDVDETLGALTDLVQPGQGPLHRVLVVLRRRRSSRRSGPRATGASSASAPSSRRTRILVRGIELDVLPTAQRHGMGILTYSPLAGGWLSGRWTRRQPPTSPARQRLAARFDMTLPENQRKLDAVEQLAAVADERRRIAHRAGDRLRGQPPGGDLGHHRAAHHRAAREPAPRRRRIARRGGPRPHRRDRQARRQPQPRRHQLRRPGPSGRRPTPLSRTKDPPASSAPRLRGHSRRAFASTLSAGPARPRKQDSGRTPRRPSSRPKGESVAFRVSSTLDDDVDTPPPG